MLPTVSTVDEGKRKLLLECGWIIFKDLFCISFFRLSEEDMMAIDEKCVEAGKV